MNCFWPQKYVKSYVEIYIWNYTLVLVLFSYNESFILNTTTVVWISLTLCFKRCTSFIKISQDWKDSLHATIQIAHSLEEKSYLSVGSSIAIVAICSRQAIFTIQSLLCIVKKEWNEAFFILPRVMCRQNRMKDYKRLSKTVHVWFETTILHSNSILTQSCKKICYTYLYYRFN